MQLIAFEKAAANSRSPSLTQQEILRQAQIYHSSSRMRSIVLTGLLLAFMVRPHQDIVSDTISTSAPCPRDPHKALRVPTTAAQLGSNATLQHSLLLAHVRLQGAVCRAADGQCTGHSKGACTEKDFTPEQGEWYGEFFPDIPKIK